MRVDQVITLVWVANVALLGGTGYVGWQFWEQKKAQRDPKAAAAAEWPDAGDAGLPVVLWPGPVTNFKGIWDTPLNGAVPPPPVVAEGPKVEKIDAAEAFRRRVQLVAVLDATSPFATAVWVTDSQGGSKSVGVGQRVDSWQLISARVDKAGGLYRASFRSAEYDKGDVEITVAIPTAEMKGEKGPFRKEYGGPAEEGPVARDKVEAQSFKDTKTGEWMVSPEECAWLEAWGEEDILQKTKFVARDQGLEVASQPPRGPLDSTREVNQGDVIVSVNGVPVKTLADLLAYFRGAGRDLVRFEIVIERDGARRTQIYNAARRRTTRA